MKQKSLIARGFRFAWGFVFLATFLTLFLASDGLVSKPFETIAIYGFVGCASVATMHAFVTVLSHIIPKIRQFRLLGAFEENLKSTRESEPTEIRTAKLPDWVVLVKIARFVPVVLGSAASFWLGKHWPWLLGCAGFLIFAAIARRLVRAKAPELENTAFDQKSKMEILFNGDGGD